MTGVLTLWLPILVSAAIVFVASSIIHMALPWHRGDYPRLPNEDQFRNAVRPLAIPPGDYMVPRAAGTKEMSTPEFTEKLRQGPVVVMTVMPNGPWAMGQALVLWFLYSVVVGGLAAYAAGGALAPGADYMAVFRAVAIPAFLGYSVALLQTSIWYRRKWSTTIKSMIDGLIFALLTAGTFGWLWPR